MFVLEELREKPKSQATFSKCMHDWIQPEKMVSYTSVWSFRFFYWLFEWFTHSFNGNLAVYEQGFVPLKSCLVEQILVFIWHLVVGSGTHWKINFEIASSYARLGMFPTALIFLILECRHEPVMKQKIPRWKFTMHARNVWDEWTRAVWYNVLKQYLFKGVLNLYQ